MLNAHGLTLTRGTRTLLTDTNFNVPSGGLLCLVGNNGTGKTSLLRALTGLLPPTQGTITRNADIHFISATPLSSSPTTPRLFLSEHAALQNGAFTTDPLGINAHIDTPLNRLSTGWRQRINLTRLTLSPHPIWLLDEPTSGLDNAAISLFLTLITAHLKSGGCAVIATHQPELWPNAQTLNMGGQHA